MTKMTITAVLFALGMTNVAGAQGLGLDLRLESDVVQKLPGVPVPLRLIAVNNTSVPQRLPFDVFIHVAREEQERFIGGTSTRWARKATDEEMEQPGFDGRLPIAARATVTADLTVSPGADTPSFLLHPFLWPAGRYTIRMLASVDEARLADAIRDATLQSVLESMPDVTVSNPLTIDVIEPQGTDAEAWQYIMEASQGEGWPSRLAPIFARELRRRFPSSQYTFSFGLAHLSDDNLADLEELATRARAITPRPPLLDWLDVAIAGRHSLACDIHLREPRNVTAAVEECETARNLYQRLITTSSSPEVRAKAGFFLQQTMPGDTILNDVLHREAIEAGTYQRVRPLLQCVKESGKRLEATFGYSNANAFTVYIGFGRRNFFSPEPEERGQPTAFLAGLHESVVSVVVDAKKNDPQRTIVWTLDGNTVSAPANGAPRCKGK